MKCPKCGYLGFEPVERCRNCGYEFSLTNAVPVAPELSLRSPADETMQPLADLELVDAAAAPPLEDAPRSDVYADRGAAVAEAEPELTLFGAAPDDAPLITRASAPRPPLSVRRATPEVPRLRSEKRVAAVEPPLPGLDFTPAVPASAALPPIDLRSSGDVARVDMPSAGIVARAVAGVVDLVLLAGIDLLVVYLTMKIAGLSPDERRLLPVIPLGAFLLIQNLGYFIAFTAGGQTLGKMLTGIKVIVDESEHAPDFARACRRTLMWVVLALPAGLGFLTTLVAADHRGLHDRLAGTRVVRAV